MAFRAEYPVLLCPCIKAGTAGTDKRQAHMGLYELTLEETVFKICCGLLQMWAKNNKMPRQAYPVAPHCLPRAGSPFISGPARRRNRCKSRRKCGASEKH